jgi:hypothetical protein
MVANHEGGRDQSLRFILFAPLSFAPAFPPTLPFYVGFLLSLHIAAGADERTGGAEAIAQIGYEPLSEMRCALPNDQAVVPECSDDE